MCFAAFTTGAGGMNLAQRPNIPGGGILGQVQNVARLRTGLTGPDQNQNRPSPQQQTQGGSLLGGAPLTRQQRRVSLLGGRGGGAR